jgi:hypothetical protein
MPVLGAAEAPDSSGATAAKLRYLLDRGAGAELQEIALRAPGRDLSLALRSPDRKVVLAATAAVRAAEDGWVLLVPLAELASRPDRPLAAAAAASAAAIAARIDETLLDEHEVTRVELGERILAWSALAGARHRWPDVRVHALEISAHLARVGRDFELGYDLAGLAADPEPEVRRAAFEVLHRPLPESARALAAQAVARDAEPVVALAAAQSLCSGLGFDEPAAPILAALGDTGLQRLRALILDPTLPPAALLDGARCLAADASPESLGVLRRLQKTGPASIRRLVAHLASGKP